MRRITSPPTDNIISHSIHINFSFLQYNQESGLGESQSNEYNICPCVCIESVLDVCCVYFELICIHIVCIVNTKIFSVIRC